MKAIVTEYTLLVSVDRPEYPLYIESAVKRLQHHVLRAAFRGRISQNRSQSWSHRLGRLMKLGNAKDLAIPLRARRGLLDVVGEISHTLFGTATDRSVQELKNVLSRTMSAQGRIVHKVNELVSVLNHTYENVAENRVRINELGAFIDRTLNSINVLVTETRYDRLVLQKLRTAFDIEYTVRALEDRYHEYLHLHNRYVMQRASLEAGRLNELLLSKEQLESVLAQETHEGVVPVRPLEWYYEYALTEPLWDQTLLLYRIRLPLVESVEYLLYQLHSWPVPFNQSGYSAQIEIEPIMGLDTVTGYVFVPSRCYGQNPQVCRFGIKTHPGRMRCERALITRELQHLENCVVKITKQEEFSQLTEITPGEYILVTWGETIHKRCVEKEPERRKLPPGVYTLKLTENCTFVGDDWRVTSLREVKGRISVLAVKVDVAPIDILKYVENNETIDYLHKFGKGELKPVMRRTLQPLKDIIEPMKTDVVDSVQIVIISGLVILALAILGIIIVHLARKHGWKCVKDSKNQTNSDVMNGVTEERREQGLQTDVIQPLFRLSTFPSIEELSSSQHGD